MKTRLDFPGPSEQKQGMVLRVPIGFYAQWRLQSGSVPMLREDDDSPPECLLQAVWQHQRLRRDDLQSLDGESVRILHPGFINREGGPDFRGAVVQFGSAPPRAGDIEVDLAASGWHAHGHDRNPAFANVILHVIWRGELPARGAPATVAIGGRLDAPLGELATWLHSEAVEVLPENLRGQCCRPLRELAAEPASALLREAAQIRFHSKAAQLQARAKQAGWEQALWEGLFRALGYKHNPWPMQCLAERRARWASPADSPLTLQARLLGLSGLLPAEPARAANAANDYFRRVWDQWWRERDAYQDCLLPRKVWRFHGQRPANHPQRRLALAAHWLAAGDLPARLERWCARPLADGELARSLLESLQVERDEFWSWHWTFRTARLARPQPLLGAPRLTDLAVNVILPWLWVRAAEGGNETVRLALEHRFHAWPAAEDNAVLRLARARLLGGAARRTIRGAAGQQGLLQIVRDFCASSNAVCAGCRFPELVREFVENPAAHHFRV
jgi:hypothetical protein